MRKFKVGYYDANGDVVAVTTETPRGPLKGIVYVGRRLSGDTVTDDVFPKYQIDTWTPIQFDDVPHRCLTLLGYHAPPDPEPEPEPVQEPSDGVSYGPPPVKPIPADYRGVALVVLVYVLAVLFFWMTK